MAGAENTGERRADPLLFREAMSRVAAAVHVITTQSARGSHGLTASAVCSVTDAPPTLLFCINRSTSSHRAFTVGAPVCVNTLAADQGEIAAVFASRERMGERFTHGGWERRAGEAPLLLDAAATFSGRIDNIVDVGTHSVMFAVVHEARSTAAPVLMYMARAYHRLPHGTATGP